jgi:hypothetical protein
VQCDCLFECIDGADCCPDGQDQAVLKQCFAALEKIMRFSASFLAELRARLKEWPAVDAFGQLFLDHVRCWSSFPV